MFSGLEDIDESTEIYIFMCLHTHIPVPRKWACWDVSSAVGCVTQINKEHTVPVGHTQELTQIYICMCLHPHILSATDMRRGGGLGSRPKKMYGERLGDGVEYHLMSPTPRC